MDSRNARMELFIARTDSRLISLEQSVAVIQATMASKEDLIALRSEMKVDNATLRSEMKADNATLRSEMKADNAALRGELKADTAALRAELKADIEVLHVDAAGMRSDMKAVATKADLLNLQAELNVALRDQTWKMIAFCGVLVTASFCLARSAPAATAAPTSISSSTVASPAPIPAPIVIQLPAGWPSTAAPAAATPVSASHP